MAKLKPNEKRVQLSFQRPDDVSLYAFLEKRAYERRYDLSTFILLSLHEAFEGQVDAQPGIPFQPDIAVQPIVSAQPVESAQPESPAKPPAQSQAPALAESTDDGYESTKAAIAANNALYAKQRKPRKGVIPGADTTPENPPASPK